MDIAVVVLPALVLLWLNCKATLVVVRDELSERPQKAIQMLLIWLLPLVGAILVLSVHRSPEPPARKYREQRDSGDDFFSSGRASKSASDGD